MSHYDRWRTTNPDEEYEEPTEAEIEALEASQDAAEFYDWLETRSPRVSAPGAPPGRACRELATLGVEADAGVRPLRVSRKPDGLV